MACNKDYMKELKVSIRYENENYGEKLKELYRNKDKNCWRKLKYLVGDKDRKFWKIPESKIIDKNYIDTLKSKLMNQLEKRTLNNEDLKRLLVMSESLKKQSSLDLIPEIGVAVTVYIGLNSITSYAIEAIKHWLVPMTILKSVISLLFFSYIIIINRREWVNKTNEAEIDSIQIVIREILDEEKSCNDLKKQLYIELQDFKNQNNKLINLTEEIKENQNNQCFIDRLLRRKW